MNPPLPPTRAGSVSAENKRHAKHKCTNLTNKMRIIHNGAQFTRVDFVYLQYSGVVYALVQPNGVPRTRLRNIRALILKLDQLSLGCSRGF